MEQYSNQKNKNFSKMEKIVKHALFIFPFLLDNSSLSGLSGANESFEKTKNDRFKIFDFR